MADAKKRITSRSKTDVKPATALVTSQRCLQQQAHGGAIKILGERNQISRPGVKQHSTGRSKRQKGKVKTSAKEQKHKWLWS